MFIWYDSEQKKLGLAYIFLSSNGKISDADLTLFYELGKTFKCYEEIKFEIIEECEKVMTVSGSRKNRFNIISDFFKKQISSDPKANRSILWTMVNLYNQTECNTDNQMQLIKLWAKESNIDNSVISEMQHICETESSLATYKNWLAACNNLPDQEIDVRKQEAEQSLKILEQSVSDLVALG